jgi:hypothetical protein
VLGYLGYSIFPLALKTSWSSGFGTKWHFRTQWMAGISPGHIPNRASGIANFIAFSFEPRDVRSICGKWAE